MLVAQADAVTMGKKYKTRSDAMAALGTESLQESVDGPLARMVGKPLIDWQGQRTCTCCTLCERGTNKIPISVAVDTIVAMQARGLAGVPILSMIGSGQVILIVNCLVCAALSARNVYSENSLTYLLPYHFPSAIGGHEFSPPSRSAGSTVCAFPRRA